MTDQLHRLVTAMPEQLDYLRDLVVLAKQGGKDWEKWAPALRGNQGMTDAAIQAIEKQIEEGEHILQDALIKLGTRWPPI